MSVTSRISLALVLIGFISCLVLLYIDISSDRLVCVAKTVSDKKEHKQMVLVKDRKFMFSVKGDKLKYDSNYLESKQGYRISDEYPHGFIRAYIQEQLVFLVYDRELDKKIIISFCVKQG